MREKEKTGLWRQDRGEPGTSCCCPVVPLVAGLVGTLRGDKQQRYKAWALWILCLEAFHLWSAGILGKVSGEGLNRLFISFSGVSVSMLIHQNVYRWVRGYFLVIFSENIIEEGLGRSGTCNHLLLSVPGQAR